MKKPALLLFAFAALFAGCATAPSVPQFATRPADFRVKPVIAKETLQQPAQRNYLRQRDPSLVTFHNSGELRKRVHVIFEKMPKETIPDEEMVLAPGERRSFYFPFGTHRVRVITERTTARHGVWETSQSIDVSVRLNGQPQIFGLSDH